MISPNPYHHLDRAPENGPPTPGSSLLRRTMTRHGSLVDRALMRALTFGFLSGDRPNLREAKLKMATGYATYADPRILTAPDRFYREPEMPHEWRVKTLNRLAGGKRLRLTFLSTYQPYDRAFRCPDLESRENRVNRVHIWQHHRPGQTTVICIHPWGGGNLALDERFYVADALYRRGFNVALFTMPLHGERTPKRALFSGQLFMSRHIQRQNEAFGQAVADIRLLMHWLREHTGRGPQGMLGYSLGGYVTALMAGLEPRLAFCVAMAAPASFPDLWWQHGQHHPERRAAELAGITLGDLRALSAIHCPLERAPQLPRERLLLVWGRGDRIVPKNHAHALWTHWQRPQIHAFDGGHLLQFGRQDYLRTALRWMVTTRDQNLTA